VQDSWRALTQQPAAGSVDAEAWRRLKRADDRRVAVEAADALGGSPVMTAVAAAAAATTTAGGPQLLATLHHQRAALMQRETLLQVCVCVWMCVCVCVCVPPLSLTHSSSSIHSLTHSASDRLERRGWKKQKQKDLRAR